MANSDWYSPSLNPVEDDGGNDTELPDQSTTVPPVSYSNCSLPGPPSFDDGTVDIIALTVCGLYLMFGLLCLLFGYRCFKAVMFFTGFVFASVIVYLICLEEAILPMWSNVLIAASAGILFGLITLLVQYVGLFMLGFHTGLLSGIIGLCVADYFEVQPHSPWISVGILLLSGLTMALLNLGFQKALTIFGSALYGGAIVATTLDYYIESAAMLVWVWDKVRVRSTVDPCWFSWAILGLWPALLLTGILTQIACTGKGIYHEKQFPSLHQRTRPAPESREERKQRKYRYLYQVRTCHGDVISQPIPRKYVQQVSETYSA